MRSSAWIGLLALLTGRVASGQQISSATNDTNTPWSTNVSNYVKIVVNGAHNASFPLLSLGQQAAQPANGQINGTLFAVDVNNASSSPSHDLLMIPCDASSYQGNLQVTNVTQFALNSSPVAIILYSREAAQCTFDNSSNVLGYPWFYTTTSADNATSLLQAAQSPGSDATLVGSNMGSGQAGNNNSGGGTVGSLLAGGSTTTAVAMIILYSITGIITALFLLIIITGAVRAHRHPERYGPRAATGGPRQSRARGIARAMLDTIPIVKFGEGQSQGQANKPVDIEMQPESAAKNEGVAHRGGEQPTATAATATETAAAAAAASPTDAPAEEAPQSSSSSSEQPDPASARAEPAVVDDSQMCSICTDEFERGQDTRVLPCRHKFHPACVDPWLLDVSGTCPLCRMDLREQEGDGAAAASGEQPPGGLAPPLDPSAQQGQAETEGTSGGRLHALLRRLQPTTAEERIEALRRFREETMNDPAAAEEHQTRWQRVRRRLRMRP